MGLTTLSLAHEPGHLSQGGCPVWGLGCRQLYPCSIILQAHLGSCHSTPSRLRHWPQDFLPSLIFILFAYDFGIFSMQAGHSFPHLPALLDFEIIRVTWFGQQNEAKVMVGHLQV